MAGGSINWYVVIPDATRNLVPNPSFEFGTAGWAGTGSPTLGTSADDQQYGAWAAQFTGAAGTVGIRAPISGAIAGGTYVASAYVRMRGTSGGQVRISLGGTSTTTVLGTSDGWTRVSVGSVGAVGSVAVQRASGALGTLWVDGVQVEASPDLSSLTTYIDGDQAGGVWEGAPHASPSYRLAQTRSGGTLVPLASLGFRPQETPDAGMWPLTNILQSYAVNAGAEYQRSRPTERTFTLMATMTGTTLADQHVTRREVIDALKIERVTPPQPNRLYYTGATGTSYLDAYYDSGLGWGGNNAVADEDAAVRFVAADPAWYGVAQQGTSLAPYTVLGPTTAVAFRDPTGRWGTMGVAGTSLNTSGDSGVYASLVMNGTVFFGGQFTTAGGTTAGGVAMWVNGAWGTLAGGTLHNAGQGAGQALVYALTQVNGTLFVGGDFSLAGGTTTNHIARWNGAWGTLTTGTIASGVGFAVYALARNPLGGVLVGGRFATVNGTTAGSIAQWNTTWGTLGGRATGGVYAMANDARYGVYMGGDFSAIAGTTMSSLARFDTFSRTFGSVTPSSVGTLQAITVTPSQDIYGAQLSAAGTVLRVRGQALLVAGTLTATYTDAGIAVAPDGNIYLAAGISTLNTTTVVASPFAIYNGNTWIPGDLIGVTQSARTLTWDGAGTMYIGGDFDGSGTAASVTTVVNSGIAESYPTLRLRNNASGTARVYQLLNTTTGDGLWFDFPMLPGEIATLVLTPGNRSFTSSARGNVLSNILAGSNFASWRLLPGTNTISFFADNPSVQADLFWNPRHASIDGGAQAVL